MLYKKLVIFLCPLLIFGGLELLFYKSDLIYFSIVAIPIILLIFLKIIIKEKFFSLDFWGLATLPLLLLFSTIGLLFLLNSDLFSHLIMIIFALVLGLYLENIFQFYYLPAHYQPHSLENFSSFLGLLIFFLFTVDLNAFYVFLNIPIWVLSLILIFILTLILLQAFWINKIEGKLRFVYLFTIDIIILQFFWALSFLPANFYVSSIILTIFLYFIWGIIKQKLSEKMEKRIIWQYLIISIILLVFIIITSAWT